MYKVLIAEDEMLVRVGIKCSVNWQSYNMEVIADVPNGQKAWEVIQLERPDVVITDIKMPVMDGIELILKLRENNFTTQIIILTCVEDFKTAQQAIALGVSGYISKLTMGESEVNALLNKIKEELDKKNSIKNQNEAFTGLKPKTEIFRDYLFYKTYSESEIDSYIRINNLRLSKERLIMCAMEIDHYEAFQNKFDDMEGHRIQSTILNILEEVLGILKIGEIVYYSNKRYYILLSFYATHSENKIHEETARIIERIRNVTKTYVEISVSFGVSPIRNGYSSLPDLYNDSNKTLDYKFIYGTGEVIYYSDPVDSKSNNKINNKIQNLRGLFKDTLGEEFGKEINGILSDHINLSGDYPSKIKNIFLHAINLITKNTSSPFIQQMPYIERIMKSETLDEIITAYREYTYRIKNKSSKYSREVSKTLKYIEENYKKDISLQEAAILVDIGSTYLSSLFKSETGINFVDYIMRIRVDKARELLLSTNMKSYEIANRTGFNDDSYFSRTFKKMTGFNPNEYRKRFHSDELVKYGG